MTKTLRPEVVTLDEVENDLGIRGDAVTNLQIALSDDEDPLEVLQVLHVYAPLSDESGIRFPDVYYDLQIASGNIALEVVEGRHINATLVRGLERFVAFDVSRYPGQLAKVREVLRQVHGLARTLFASVETAYQAALAEGPDTLARLKDKLTAANWLAFQKLFSPIAADDPDVPDGILAAWNVLTGNDDFDFASLATMLARLPRVRAVVGEPAARRACRTSAAMALLRVMKGNGGRGQRT